RRHWTPSGRDLRPDGRPISRSLLAREARAWSLPPRRAAARARPARSPLRGRAAGGRPLRRRALGGRTLRCAPLRGRALGGAPLGGRALGGGTLRRRTRRRPLSRGHMCVPLLGSWRREDPFSICRRGSIPFPRPAHPGRIELLLPAVHGPLQLLFVHLRAAGDIHFFCFVVELLFRPPLLAVRSGTLAAALSGGHVGAGKLRGRLRLAASRTLLIDRAGRNLFRAFRRRAALLGTLLDVLVLTLTLVAPR